jgi:hypothetical protein
MKENLPQNNTKCTLKIYIFLPKMYHRNVFSPPEVFQRLLGPTSFDSFKGHLDCKQAFLPITFSGIRTVPTTTIALTTYLRSWALIVSIIFCFVYGWSMFLPPWNISMNWQQHLPFPPTPQGDIWFSIAPNLCVFSFVWIIHRATNGLTSKFHLKTFTPSYVMLFDKIFKPIMLEFDHILA